MRTIPSSELIINADGSIYHLRLKPGQLADTVILVGDPGRVNAVAARMESVEADVSHREFHTVTGTYRGKRLSVISTGIGTDNIDIVMTELDALVNVDFSSRTENRDLKSLTILRLGTCGALQPDIPLGALIFSHTSGGLDGLLNFYKGRNEICNLEMERQFVEHVGPNKLLAAPYFVDADHSLQALFRDCTIEGITLSAPGFYAPQGRWVRLEPADPNLNARVESFRYKGKRITNYEMESSALAGLAALMGHRAGTICTVVAQRASLESDADHSSFIEGMITIALDRLAAL